MSRRKDQEYIFSKSSISGHPIEDVPLAAVGWRIKFNYRPFVQDQDPQPKKRSGQVSIISDLASWSNPALLEYSSDPSVTCHPFHFSQLRPTQAPCHMCTLARLVILATRLLFWQMRQFLGLNTRSYSSLLVRALKNLP